MFNNSLVNSLKIINKTTKLFVCNNNNSYNHIKYIFSLYYSSSSSNNQNHNNNNNNNNNMTSTPNKIASVYCEIDKLRPTQCAVGLNHVQRKVNELKELKSNQGIEKVSEFLKSHPAPVVIKNDEVFLIDNHHLCRALHELGDNFFKDIPLDDTKSLYSSKPIMYINVVSDLSHLSDQTEFWNKMNQEKWVHPYNKDGEGPVNVNEIPKQVGLMEDDIFRSIAAVVKIKGGFKKSFIPYAEFQWANYFRSCFKDKQFNAKSDFEKLITESLELSKDQNAKHLPGYIDESNSN